MKTTEEQTTEFPANSPTKPPTKLGGAYAITKERERQIVQEGFTAIYDAKHDPSTLLAAGACYLNLAGTILESGVVDYSAVPEHWPWEAAWWKPSHHPDVNMIKGGALVAAALDRFWNLAPGFLPAPVDAYRPTEAECLAWADRNGVGQSNSAVRTAIDDARTMHELRHSTNTNTSNQP